jgi:hypothetical protein
MSDVTQGAAPEAAPAPTTVVETPSASVFETEMEAVYDKNYPQERVTRDPNGQFKSKAATPAVETSADVPDSTTNPDQGPAADTTEQAKPAISRPVSWSADLDEWWASLPPERQQFFAKRETEVSQKITDLGQKASQAERLAQVGERYRHVISQGSLDREVENLLATKDALIKNPEQSIQWLAQQLGVDLSKFGQAPIGQQSDADPQLGPLRQHIANLERQLSGFQNDIMARQQREDAARVNSLAATVDDFAKDKDYWKEIEPEVAIQVAALKQANPDKAPMEILKEAHDRAVRLNDAISERLNKAKRDKEAADKAAAEKRKADEAKKLASLNPKSSPGSPRSTPLNMEDEMGQIFDRITARG